MIIMSLFCNMSDPDPHFFPDPTLHCCMSGCQHEGLLVVAQGEHYRLLGRGGQGKQYLDTLKIFFFLIYLFNPSKVACRSNAV